MDREEEEASFEKFLEWASEVGVTDSPITLESQNPSSSCLGHSLSVAHFPEAGGRGLGAARDLRKGELVLRVPKSVLMTRESVLRDQRLSVAVNRHSSLSSNQLTAQRFFENSVASRTMIRIYIQRLFILLCVIGGLPFGLGIESKSLNVGEERWAETLPLQMGSQRYQLQGLKSNTWYEVKISYPASIPASFSIQLKRGVSDLDSELNRNRRLLNTEKLIFKTDSLDSHSNQDGWYVLVNVEPEGIVAIPHVKEREFIVFNIVCDELLLGIPHQAWLVVALVLLCLILSFIIPKFLPSFLLPNNQSSHSVVTKNS